MNSMVGWLLRPVLGYGLVLKANPYHDSKGRFSSAPGPAQSAFAEANKITHTPRELIKSAFGGDKELMAEYQAVNDKVEAAVRAGKETYRAHVTNLDALDSGKTYRAAYSPERLAEHNRIINEILQGSEKYKAKEGTKPEVMFLGGRGGAGKGNFDKAKGNESGVYDSSTHLVLDPDHVKSKMKEYSPEMAYLVHRESADIFDKLVTRARTRKLNVVLDKTMRHSPKSMVNSFEKHGYDMQAHYMHMPPEGAAIRALGRWKKGEDTPVGVKTKRGRLVPPQVILKMTDNEKHFDSILPKMKKWSVWSNTRPMGLPPKKITDSSEVKPAKKWEQGFSSLFLHQVQKANPYHDEKGRFTSHGKAASVSLWGAKTANINSPAKHAANSYAAGHHQAKVKEFSHILGTHVRQGGSISDATGQKLLDQAKLHAEGLKTYATHVAPPDKITPGFRDTLANQTANAFAESGLSVASKVKHGIPLTEAEHAAILKSKEYDKQHYSKKQKEKVTADLISMGEKLTALQNQPGFEKNPEFIKLAKKVSKASALGKKHGLESDQIESALQQGKINHSHAKNKALDAYEAATKSLHEEILKGSVASTTPAYSAHLKAKEDALKLVSQAELDAAHQKAANHVKAEHQVAKDVLSQLHQKHKNILSIETGKKLNEAYKAHVDKYGSASAEEAISHGDQMLAAKKATGTEPVSSPKHLEPKQPSVAEVLTGKPSGPGVAKSQSFKEPKTKQEALDTVHALGKQYYLLKEGKYPNASKTSPPQELADAYGLYSKAKAAYEKHGGDPGEFPNISMKLKDSAKNELASAAHAKKTAQDSLSVALHTASKHYMDTKSGFGASSAKAKEAEKAMNLIAKEAKKHLSEAEVNASIAKGVQTHLDSVAATKKAALQTFHDASYNLHYATLKHKDNPNHEEVLKAASEFDAVAGKQAGSKLVKQADLVKASSEAKAAAKANLKSEKEFAKKYGSATKVASLYDKEAGTFKYRNKDPSFAAHGNKQIAKLSPQERLTVSSYTGSSFTSLNKAVGAFGTAKMKGLSTEPLSDDRKAQMKHMDAVFAKTTLGENVNLRRNMPQKYFWEQLGLSVERANSMSQEELNKMVGKVYKETAYSSTSMRKDFDASFASETWKTGGAALRIRAGKDMPGMYAKSLSKHSSEDEVILPRGTTYVVRKVTRLNDGSGNNKVEIHVDMIGAFPDKL